MSYKRVIQFLTLTLVMLLAVSAFADTINNRPVTDSILNSTGGSEASLKEIFTSIGATSYAADVYGTQSKAALFISEGSSGAIASFIIELAGNSATNVAGIYNPTSGQLVPIFNGAETPAPSTGIKATISFLGNGSVVVSDSLSTGKVVQGTYAGFGNVFGLYLHSGATSNTFYSEDSKNGGNPQVLAYQGNGLDSVKVAGGQPGTFSTDEWIFAFEDLPYVKNASSVDFNDLVFLVESIKPVPEPTTMLLLGFGLVGLAGIRRKIKK